MENYQKIVATGLLVHNQQILIIKRHDGEKFLPGQYELAGGKVDFGEDPEVALIREYKEETSLDIKVEKPIRTFSYISDNNHRHTVEIVYLVTLLDNSAAINLGKDHTDYRWIKKSEASQYFAADDQVMQTIQQLDLE